MDGRQSTGRHSTTRNRSASSRRPATRSSPNDARNQEHRFTRSRLRAGEIEALHFLSGRYESAKVLFDGLAPLDASADRAIGREFDRGEGPYRFQVRAADVRKTLRATADDGGDYGAIPNLRSDAVDWLLAQEPEQSGRRSR